MSARGVECVDYCLENGSTEVEGPEFLFTGHGRGSYEKVTQLRRVGQGYGSWERELLRHEISRPSWCSCCGVVLTLILAALLLCAYFWLPWQAALSALAKVLPQDAPSYDSEEYDECSGSFGRWEDVSLEKIMSCCQKFGLGCRAMQFLAASEGQAEHMEPSPEADLRTMYRCSDTIDTQTTWSRSKAAFCCQQEGLGCETWQSWRHGGHKGGIAWKHDCNGDADRWYFRWSSARKAWCCQNVGRGCMLYRCEGSVSDWSSEKREWCCQHAHNGCNAEVSVDTEAQCHAACSLNGAEHSCFERITWTAEHVFASSPVEVRCQEAHKRVASECAVCQGCQLQSACFV